MASNYTHRNLILWQRAQDLGHRVIQLTHRLPQTWPNAILARQIIGSATSVGANIAEGHGRYTPAAHRHHLLIARGSAAETDSWLDQLRRSAYLTAEEEAPLQRECGEIIAMLTAKVRMLDQRGDSSHIREDREDYTAMEDMVGIFSKKRGKGGVGGGQPPSKPPPTPKY